MTSFIYSIRWTETENALNIWKNPANVINAQEHNSTQLLTVRITINKLQTDKNDKKSIRQPPMSARIRPFVLSTQPPVARQRTPMIVYIYAQGRIENKPAYPGRLMKMPFCSPGVGIKRPIQVLFCVKSSRSFEKGR